jgi:hypothetical protein
MSHPPDWKPIEVTDDLTFFVPPDAQEEEVQPIDSIFGIVNGPGYQIIYDYGRFSEAVDTYQDRPDFRSKSRKMDGWQAHEVSFEDAEESPERPFVRLLQIPHKGPNTFTLRVSCVDEDTCRVADLIFDSVSFQ